MRTVLILFSLVPICSLGADLVIRILFPPAGLLSSEQTLYSTGELLLVMADIILWGVYYWQQGRSINQQIKRQGMSPLIKSELFRGTITEAKRPYLREGRLTFIVWIHPCIHSDLCAPQQGFLKRIITRILENSGRFFREQALVKLPALPFG